MARGIVRSPHAIDATSQRVPFTEDTALNLVQHGFRHFNLCAFEAQQRSELSQRDLASQFTTIPANARGFLVELAVSDTSKRFCPLCRT